ncbi:hypothetical protein SteCoe_6431 [Stentor coeruleus]|uniref:PPM-type phosphatase domain-containing protein n=1 Tax=Stentor coeruleus TaxID=5963 RepID=A0A1R2CQ12_9CILI|nr:hypothetical protein SteCoe_6431 [Stentor coeruleus]
MDSKKKNHNVPKSHINAGPKKTEALHSSVQSKSKAHNVVSDTKVKIAEPFISKSPKNLSEASKIQKSANKRANSSELVPPEKHTQSRRKIKIGYLSKTGSSPDMPKKVNQDSMIVIENFLGQPNCHLFGVFDGHGQYGKEISSFIKDRLPILFSNDNSFIQNPKQSILNCVQQLQADILRSKFDTSFSGSTMVLVLMLNDMIICANVGDSRAVLGKVEGKKWVPVTLSRDHKPDLQDERVRIQSHGGRVEPFTDDDGRPYGPPRVWISNLDYPGIAMSRSLGDSVAASIGVISTPEIIEHQMQPCDKFIILGSDGLFEFLSSNDIVRTTSTLTKTKDPDQISHILVRNADECWRKEEESIDDITCICVFLDSDR